MSVDVMLEQILLSIKWSHLLGASSSWVGNMKFLKVFLFEKVAEIIVIIEWGSSLYLSTFLGYPS